MVFQTGGSYTRTVDVVLFHRPSRKFTPAQLLREMTPEDVEAAAESWEPYFDRAIRGLVLSGTPRSAWPQHLHWNWRYKARATAGLEGYQFSGILCDDAVQGLMLTTIHQSCRVVTQQQSPMVYIHFLETAPWNLHELAASPEYGGVGQILVADAITQSLRRGWEGRVGLHALPQAQSFYRELVGMTDLGVDPIEGLVYFESTPEQARAFVGE